MDVKKSSVYVYFGFVILLIVLAILILKPFFATIAFAAVFAYWLFPLHRRLSKRINDTISATLISAVLFLGLLALIQYGLFIFVREVVNLSGELSTLNMNSTLASFFGKDILSAYTTRTILNNVASTFASRATSLIYGLPTLIVSFFTFILAFFYFLKDGRRIGSWLKNNIPFPKDKRNKLLRGAKEYVDAFLKAQLVIGLLQGIVCALGFFLFGLNEYILVGSLAAALLSILPIVGPYILYVPIGAVLYLQGNYAVGIGILIYGLAIGSFLDYIIRPQLTGKYASMHPLSVLVGVLGGMVVFGLAGIFIGPIVLGLCITVIEGISEYRIGSKIS